MLYKYIFIDKICIFKCILFPELKKIVSSFDVDVVSNTTLILSQIFAELHVIIYFEKGLNYLLFLIVFIKVVVKTYSV